MSNSESSSSSWRIALAALAALAVALLVWFVFVRGDDDAGAEGGPQVVEAGEISARAAELGRPIYWAGERDGARYELSESESGRVYVRYLDEDAEAGERSTEFLTIGTYPSKNAVAALRRAAHTQPEAELARGDDGSTVLINPKTPGSVHIAYPDSDWQVEVYSPDVEEGLRLAKEGGVKPAQ